MDKERTGRLIAVTRKEKGMTQQELAEENARTKRFGCFFQGGQMVKFFHVFLLHFAQRKTVLKNSLPRASLNADINDPPYV